MKLLIVFSLLMSVVYFSVAEDAPKVAVASIIRGDVDLLIMGKTVKLKKDDWVKEGSVVKTADKSFVKLIFIDKSQMNIGPNSEMKIAKFIGSEAGIIDLVKGKIRSQVTKDYLQIKDKDKSKMFIKTPNAVMGIRGTDFLISFHPTGGNGNSNSQSQSQGNSSVVLFEGDVAFNKLDTKNITNPNALENAVNEGVRVAPGEFTVVDPNHPKPTLPAILNVQQREALEKNESFDQRSPSNESASDDSKKSIVPVGLTSTAVSAESGTIKNEVALVSGPTDATTGSDSKDTDGYIKGDLVKPANGSVLHETGAIIPPDAGSSLDTNTDSYSVPSNVKIGSDGSVTIKGGEINSEGKLMTTVVGSDGKVQVVVRDLPPPIKIDAPLSAVGQIGLAPTQPPLSAIQKNPDITLNPNGTGILPPPPSGGIQNVNDAVQQFNNKTKTTINAN